MTKIIALLAPSASGKTAIINQLLKTNTSFRRVKTTTTRCRRENEDKDAYDFISLEEFLQKEKAGIFFESSIYAGEHYGTPLTSITEIIDAGNIAIVPIDINGIKAYKKKFGDEMMAIFIYRDKKDVLEAIVERTIPSAEKAKRILSLDKEYENISACDYAIINNGTLDDAVKKIVNLTK